MRAISLMGVALLGAFTAAVLAAPAAAKPFYQGSKVCQECHDAQYKVWDATTHGKSFRTIHKAEGQKEILAAAGGDKNMRKNEICTTCHFTMEQKNEADSPDAKSGPACESCHGPSSDWLKVHNNYGGKDVKKEQETADNKAKRQKDAAAAGMVWPFMKYDVAMNCMNCHGLANPKMDGAVLGKMLDAGHPFKPEYELITYSQGQVKHWPERAAKDLAYTFVSGQAAKLVSAASVMTKSDSAKYKDGQAKRAAMAKEALAKIPEAKPFLDQPTEANARTFLQAVAAKDLSSMVTLPAKGAYK